MMEEVEIHPVSGTKDNPALVVRNAFKRYSATNIIFNGLNLTVPEGKIYGLLGPSGCGKTTLLNCIVGRSFLDSGSIQLITQSRRDVGFMPQFTSLYVKLNILENFFVYGYLMGMSKEQILARSKEFTDLLELPPANSLIENLSGGQQRRVSLAVTLIHDPQLYVLDEPTVGLDPVLSQSIWRYLLQQTSLGKTVIITTHYIQEAKQSHTIGIMRNGKLLAEEPPSNLIDKYQCDDLEEVFLELSKRQENHEEDNSGFPEKSQRVQISYNDDKQLFSTTRFKAVLYKNYTLLKREYVFLLLLCLLPISQTFFGNYTLGVKPKNLIIEVVNHETSLDKCNDMMTSNCFLNGSHHVYLSCVLLDYLKKESYIMVENHNVREPSSFTRDNIIAALQFPENYTNSIIERYNEGFRTSDDYVDGTFMDIWIDKSNQYLAACVKYDVARFTMEFMKQALRNCRLHPDSGFITPLKIEEPIFGKLGESYSTQVAPIMLTLCCFFLPTMFTGGIVFLERLSGALERLIISGATTLEVIVSILVLQIGVHLVQTSEAMFVTYVWFDNPIAGNTFTLIWLMLAIGISGMFFGLMLGTLNKNMTVTVYTGIGANIAMAFTTGMSWPLEGAHYLLQAVAIYVPNTLAVQAAQAIGFKSFTFFNPLVLMGFASCIVWSAIFLTITCVFIKLNTDVWVINK